MQTKLYHYHFLSIFLVVLLISCGSAKKGATDNKNENCITSKIKFKLTIFDENGLIGTENNKVSLDYEFCIPNQVEYLTKIREIDSSIKPLNGKGRTKCAENYIVMIGNSYHKDIKKTLCKLSQLEYITEINQVYWE